MMYVYGATLEGHDHLWKCSVDKMPVEGRDRSAGKACKACAVALKDYIADQLAGGQALPAQRFNSKPDVVLCVEVDASIAPGMLLTVGEAAEELGITPGRASQLATMGYLETVRRGNKRMVTRASVERRKEERRDNTSRDE